jgi:hypothetical protein
MIGWIDKTMKCELILYIIIDFFWCAVCTLFNHTGAQYSAAVEYASADEAVRNVVALAFQFVCFFVAFDK